MVKTNKGVKKIIREENDIKAKIEKGPILYRKKLYFESKKTQEGEKEEEKVYNTNTGLCNQLLDLPSKAGWKRQIYVATIKPYKEILHESLNNLPRREPYYFLVTVSYLSDDQFVLTKVGLKKDSLIGFVYKKYSEGWFCSCRPLPAYLYAPEFLINGIEFKDDHSMQLYELNVENFRTLSMAGNSDAQLIDRFEFINDKAHLLHFDSNHYPSIVMREPIEV